MLEDLWMLRTIWVNKIMEAGCKGNNSTSLVAPTLTLRLITSMAWSIKFKIIVRMAVMGPIITWKYRATSSRTFIREVKANMPTQQTKLRKKLRQLMWQRIQASHRCNQVSSSLRRMKPLHKSKEEHQWIHRAIISAQSPILMDFWIRVNKDLLTKMSFPKLKFKIETTKDKLIKRLLSSSHILCLANRCLLPKVMIWQLATLCHNKTCNRFRNKLWARASLSKGHNLNHRLNRKTHSTVQTRDRCIQIASQNLHLRQKLEYLLRILTRRTKMHGSQCLTSVV